MAKNNSKTKAKFTANSPDDGKAGTFEKAIAYFQSDEINSGKLKEEQAVERAAEKFPKSHKAWLKKEE